MPERREEAVALLPSLTAVSDHWYRAGRPLTRDERALFESAEIGDFDIAIEVLGSMWSVGAADFVRTLARVPRPGASWERAPLRSTRAGADVQRLTTWIDQVQMEGTAVLVTLDLLKRERERRLAAAR